MRVPQVCVRRGFGALCSTSRAQAGTRHADPMSLGGSVSRFGRHVVAHRINGTFHVRTRVLVVAAATLVVAGLVPLLALPAPSQATAKPPRSGSRRVGSASPPRPMPVATGWRPTRAGRCLRRRGAARGHDGHDPQPAGRRHGSDPRRWWLLARRSRRRDLHIRDGGVLGIPPALCI